MRCDRCQTEIHEQDAHDHCGQTLCDDCYMDALSPARSCDPWAVHSAKRLEASGSQGLQLNETQERIIQFLRDTGGAGREAICEQLHLEPDVLQREFAALRHMEKARGQMKDGKVVLCVW